MNTSRRFLYQRVYLIIAIIGLLMSCQIDIFGVSSTHIIDNFYVHYIEGRDQMCLFWEWKPGSGPCLVHPTVFAAGYNDKYIIVKRHPEILRGKYSPRGEYNPKITEFYIVPRNVDYAKYKSEEEIIGPMSKQEFDLKRKQLGIPDSVDFTIVFEDLE